MNKTPLYDLALSVPWCITSEALDAILSIAAHTPWDAEQIAQVMHGPRAPQALAMRTGTKRDDTQKMTMRDGVAVLRIDGPIFRYADFFTDMSGGTTTDSLALNVQLAMDDPQTKALLLVIDSPGGESTGINELANMIYSHRGTKPIGAYAEGLFASAAYWIGSAVDIVGMDATAWAGSIGTVLGVPDPQKQVSRSIEIVSSQSPKKRPDPYSEAGRAYLQKLADEMTEVFIASVMRNRGMSRDEVLAVEGGMLVGEAAVQAKLADQITSEEAMIALLRDRAAQQSTEQRTLFALQHSGGTSMDWKAFWGGLIGAANESSPTPLAEALAESGLSAHDKPTHQSQTELEQLRAQLAESRKSEATSLVQQLVAQNKILPAEASALEQVFVQAAADDAAHGTITLNGEQTTRVALLKTTVASRTPHSLTSELLPVDPSVHQTLANLQTTPTAASVEQAEIEQVKANAKAYALKMNGKGA